MKSMQKWQEELPEQMKRKEADLKKMAEISNNG